MDPRTEPPPGEAPAAQAGGTERPLDDGLRTPLIGRSSGSLGFFAVTACLMALDVVSDLVLHGADLAHVALELLLAIVAVSGVVYFARRAIHEQRERLEVTRALAVSEAERERLRAQAAAWREEAREALSGLADAIDHQFERWGLTTAEREVALLLLKGLSFKEAAEARGTSERTVRQQALTVYKKADVAGRAELSAFFLEDLLAPKAPRA